MIYRSAMALALTVAVPLLASGPAAAQTTGETAARVLELEDEIRRLNGRIEELEFRLRQIADDATRRFGDIEYRLTELEGGDPSVLGDPIPLGQTGAPKSSDQGPVAAVSERAALDEGIAAVQAGDHAAARRLLENFMVTYSGGPLIGEAEHWLGEAFYRQGDYRRAASTFLTNVTDRREHERSGESFIRLGQSLDQLGHVGEACQTFAEAARRHADDANTVAQAEAERERLDCP